MASGAPIPGLNGIVDSQGVSPTAVPVISSNPADAVFHTPFPIDFTS